MGVSETGATDRLVSKLVDSALKFAALGTPLTALADSKVPAVNLTVASPEKLGAAVKRKAANAVFSEAALASVA